MRLSLILASAMWLAPSAAVHSQQANAEVLATINNLFKAMRTGDTTLMRAVFAPDAKMSRAVVADGVPTIRGGSVEGFIQAVGSNASAQDWNEQIWEPEIKVDRTMAVAWTPYTFHRGKEFSHCGVNAFQLAKAADGWKIVSLIDTSWESCASHPGMKHSH